MTELKDLIPLAVGVLIAFLVRVYTSAKGDVVDTLGAEAKRVLLPALLAFAGFMAAGETYTQAAAHALMSAGVALGLSGSKPPPKPPMGGMLVILALSQPGCAAALQALMAAQQGAQYLSTAIAVAESGTETYFDRHPNQTSQAEVQAAIVDAKAAALALDAALKAAESVKDGDVIAATAAAREAYARLYKVLAALGVLDARAPEGGAENATAPRPRPLRLPKPAMVL